MTDVSAALKRSIPVLLVLALGMACSGRRGLIRNDSAPPSENSSILSIPQAVERANAGTRSIHLKGTVRSGGRGLPFRGRLLIAGEEARLEIRDPLGGLQGILVRCQGLWTLTVPRERIAVQSSDGAWVLENGLGLSLDPAPIIPLLAGRPGPEAQWFTPASRPAQRAGCRVRGPDGAEARVYFDRKTCLPVRVEGDYRGEERVFVATITRSDLVAEPPAEAFRADTEGFSFRRKL